MTPFVRQTRLLVFATVAAFTAAATHIDAQQLSPEARTERVRVVQAVMAGELARIEKELSKNPDKESTRTLPNAALLMLRAQRPGVDAEAMLNRVFAVQNMDASSPNFGTIPWSFSDATISDGNAIEFNTQPMGAIFLRYADKLSPAFLKSARPHLEAAMVALSKHVVKVSYTNIYLMNTLNTLQLAEYLHDDTSAKRGRDQWIKWRAYTAENGIHEFNSPTYYGTDLADLTYGHVYIDDPVIHQQIVEAERLFWTDVALHVLKRSQRLTGAESRDYCFLTGRGSFEMDLYLEGLIDLPKDGFTEPFLEKVASLENQRTGAYHPTPDILALADLPERYVRMRYDENHAYLRTDYLTQQFAIGTADGAYGGQDKMFAVDLAGSPVVISMDPDRFGAPYGLVKKKEGSGHSKPEHLPANLSSVQDKGLALLVLDLDPRKDKDGPVLDTSLLLPSTADEMTLNGTPVTPSSSFAKSATVDSVVGVRVGTSCFAARIFDVEPLNTMSAAYQLRADSDVWHTGAMRFAILQSGQPVSGQQQHLHITMLAEVRECGTAGLAGVTARLKAAKMSTVTNTSRFTAKATLENESLEVEEDLSQRLPSSRKVNGKEVSTPLFEVNGKQMQTLVP